MRNRASGCLSRETGLSSNRPIETLCALKIFLASEADVFKWINWRQRDMATADSPGLVSAFNWRNLPYPAFVWFFTFRNATMLTTPSTPVCLIFFAESEGSLGIPSMFSPKTLSSHFEEFSCRKLICRYFLTYFFKLFLSISFNRELFGFPPFPTVSTTQYLRFKQKSSKSCGLST